MPRVSIIIAAYNPGAFLDVAVQSVVDQTYADWDLIVIDDGGTEDLSRLSGIDSRIRLHKQANRGTSAARNAGILKSSGDLIAFLDHDDYWYPTKLAKQVELMDKELGVGMCYTNFETVDERGKRLYAPYCTPISGYLDLLRLEGGPCLSTTMMRREALAASGLFDPCYPGTQDYDLFLKLARLNPIAFVPSCEAAYRLHANNASSNYIMVYRELENLAHKHLILARANENVDAIDAAKQMLRNARPAYGAQAFDRCRASLRAGRYLAFFRHLSWSLRLAPAYVSRSLLRWVGSRVGMRRLTPQAPSS